MILQKWFYYADLLLIYYHCPCLKQCLMNRKFKRTAFIKNRNHYIMSLLSFWINLCWIKILISHVNGNVRIYSFIFYIIVLFDWQLPVLYTKSIMSLCPISMPRIMLSHFMMCFKCTLWHEKCDITFPLRKQLDQLVFGGFLSILAVLL